MLAAVAGAGDVGQVKSGKDLRFRTGYLEVGGVFFWFRGFKLHEEGSYSRKKN